MEILDKIKNELLISLTIDKEPYEKILTEDNIINLTGESGSGKSYYADKYLNGDDYIIIDTDEVFQRYDRAIGINKELGIYFRNKYGNVLPSLFDNFDLIYDEIIDYFSNTSITIVIDSAQFRNMKDLSILRGKIIIIRTSINTCYNRCIDRYKKNNPGISDEEMVKYKEKKKGIFQWYHSLNNFLIKIADL